MSIDTQASPETQRLTAALVAVTPGHEITYDDLSEVIGQPVQYGRARSLLSTARRAALRDHGAAFECVRGRGLRRLTPDEAPSIGQSQRRHIRRTSKRAVRDMAHVANRANALSEDAQRSLSIEIAAHGLLAHIAKDRVAENIPDNAEAKPTPLAITARRLADHMQAK